jgi:hypothetical protein
MPTYLRAFLMLRTQQGEWTVSVYRDLEELLGAWKQRADPNHTTGIIHVGFDRPPCRDFELVACHFAGRALVTASAKFALPADFHASAAAAATVGGLPVFVATRGWGYLTEDTTDVEIVKPLEGHSRKAEGWVRNFLAEFPAASSQLSTADIWSDSDYLAREGNLPFEVRRDLGVFRFRQLIGDSQDDPCAFARAAPPWVTARTFASLATTVRVANGMVLLGLTQVSELAQQSHRKLLDTPNFGKKSVNDLLGALNEVLYEGPPRLGEDANGHPRDLNLLSEVRRALITLKDRERDVIRHRMGFEANVETLQEIADRHGLTRERVRQIEAAIVSRLRKDELWERLLRNRLRTLVQNRKIPIPVLGVEALDRCFTGMSDFIPTFRYLLDNFIRNGVQAISIDGLDYLALLTQEQWGNTLLEARRFLESSTSRGWSELHCRSVVEGLLPSTAREFSELLWEKASKLCHFTDTAQGIDGAQVTKVLISYGRGAERVVETILQEAELPLHFSEIAELAGIRAGRDIDLRRAHNAAASVGLLLGRGVYGSDRHLPLDQYALALLGEEAEDIVSNGPPGRQWHTSEILEALAEQGSSGASVADKYLINIALRRSRRLVPLGRMIWIEGGKDGERRDFRIDLRQAIIVLLQQSGRALRTNEIHQRLLAVRGVNELFQIQLSDPLIRVGPALWGLNDRDIPVKRADQASLLENLFDILCARGVAIHASELGLALKSYPSISPVAIFSLCSNDPRMRVDQAHYLFLAEWGGPRRESISIAVEAILSSLRQPLSFEKIGTLVDIRVGRTCPRSSISGALKAIEASFDHATALWSLPERDGPLKDDDDILAA